MTTILKVKMKDGFSMKLIGEIISSTLKFLPVRINEKGIIIQGMDRQSEVCLDIELQKENFTVFKCPTPISFMLNPIHFYRLLKNIKKKNSVTLFINDQRPMQLGICVQESEENSDKVTTYINIVYIQPETIEIPTGYGDPISSSSKRFQKLKMLHGMGNEMKITLVGKSTIKCFVNGKNLYSREIPLGEDSDSEDEEEQQLITQTYSTNHITQLTKCSGQNSIVQIYFSEELPLKIKMNIGNLGILSVYIKSKELIQSLSEEPEEQTEEPEENQEESDDDDEEK